jgi:amino-acid N-acetyltransferase
MTADSSLRPADDGDLSSVETLLESEDLPTRDIQSKSDSVYVAYDGDEPVGAGGIERYDSDGLVRSVVVERTVRERGVGAAIVAALERSARGRRRDALSAHDDRRRLLRRPRLRRDRPERRPGHDPGTAEFDDLCPSTAACLAKSL